MAATQIRAVGARPIPDIDHSRGEYDGGCALGGGDRGRPDLPRLSGLTGCSCRSDWSSHSTIRTVTRGSTVTDGVDAVQGTGGFSGSVGLCALSTPSTLFRFALSEEHSPNLN